MCQLLHSDSCSFLLPLLLVRGTAGPSRRQSSWPHIHESVLRTAWPPDNRCEMVQRESSFGSHSCHPATGRLLGLGGTKRVNARVIAGEACVHAFLLPGPREEQAGQRLLPFGNTSSRSGSGGAVFILCFSQKFLRCSSPLPIAMISDIPRMRLKE